MEISAAIAQSLNLPSHGVEATLKLLAEGATIPFISRYRKEATGSLNEVQIFEIDQMARQLEELAKRKETVKATIQESGKLTEELSRKIDETTTIASLEDIYLPFKPKRRTRATIARENGLEPLARMIMGHGLRQTPLAVAERFTGNNIPDAESALSGACDIIAEWVSESESARRTVRQLFERNALIETKVAKEHIDDTRYSDYHNYSGDLKRCPSHRYLAIRRAEAEGILRVTLNIDPQQATDRLNRIFCSNISPLATDTVKEAVGDSYKRLLKPSIENETASMAKERADKAAIDVFADNLRQLLMAPPLGPHNVMGIDPGFRTGCKVVCLNEAGKLLYHDVIYPTAPRMDLAGAERKIKELTKRFNVVAIAVGNGTASRETERFLKDIKWDATAPDIHIVNEAGASVYSASELARKEFPDQDVTVRGAISIGRRLMDPMAELVKIDPKSIGVGQYQHDVDQSALKRSLDNTVTCCVNSVGVNLNTASPQLLSYVSGIGPKLADAIVEYRQSNGKFKTRSQLLNVPRLGNKVYTQAAGFLRIPNGENPLDNTAVHPERYQLVNTMAKDANCTVEELIKQPQTRKSIDLKRYVSSDVGMPTLCDIMEELERPGRDPRGEVSNITFDDTITDITDLKPGMKLPGIVNNITAFGAFVDLGIHHSGLIHLSQMSNRYISHPNEVLKLGQHVNVTVIEVDLERKRIGLSLK